MSLEKEAKEYLKAEDINNRILRSNHIINDKFTQKSRTLATLISDFATQQTEKLREEVKKWRADHEDCICCNGSGLIDEGEEPYESKINDCMYCNGTGVINKELQQTKEKLKRCEEVIKFAHEVLSCFEFAELWNHGFNKDFVLSQLKDNG